MFRVDRSTNRISRLPRARFSEYGLRERDHLQEWLAHQPDALDEPLLVIQKEFDGFADTRERLDLLALDAEGQLVVIENKLDDSGRDVVWQALKYAAYVSSLTKAQVLDIYQSYLDRYEGGGDAAQRICEFLGIEALDEAVLNPGHRQRMVFIAAHFRKEVTATVLWLREHGIDARCLKVVPYPYGEELFIDIQPVIPTPEAADFMISMAEKETEEKSAQVAQRKTEKLRQEYWTLALEALRKANVGLYQNISTSDAHWLTAGSGIASCGYALIFLKRELRVELSFSRFEAAENKWLFDRLMERKDQIEAAFGHPIEWLRLDAKKASRIQFSYPCDGYDRERWPEYIAWHVTHMQKWEKALRGPLNDLNQAFKLREGTSDGVPV